MTEHVLMVMACATVCRRLEDAGLISFPPLTSTDEGERTVPEVHDLLVCIGERPFYNLPSMTYPFSDMSGGERRGVSRLARLTGLIADSDENPCLRAGQV